MPGRLGERSVFWVVLCPVRPRLVLLGKVGEWTWGGPHTQPQPRGLTSSPHLCLVRHEILAWWLGEDTAAQRGSTHVCKASAQEGLSIHRPLGFAPHLPLLRDSPRVSEKSSCPRHPSPSRFLATGWTWQFSLLFRMGAGCDLAPETVAEST